MEIDMKQFHQVFFEESFEGLDIMESNLLNLDIGTADSEMINTIFRAAHSIKGGSGTFGFTAIASFTHLLETLLDEVRDGQRDITKESVDLLLKSVDCLRELLTTARDGSDFDPIQCAEVQNQLEAMLATKGDSTVTEAAATTDNQESANEGWTIKFTPHPSMLATGNDPIRIIRVLSELGECRVTLDDRHLPSFKDINAEECFLAWDIVITGDVSKEQIDEAFEWVEDECDLDISAIVTETNTETIAEADNTQKAVPAARKKVSSAESASIRVDIDKVDDIINLVGELVITQSMLGQIGDGITVDSTVSQNIVSKLRDGLAQLERNTRELQESVMRIRMLPISFVFNRFPRMIHDLASALDKKVELVIKGETTELDKTVMEKIGDPMVHLVRNSLDHGLESTADRIAANKPEMGTIELNAFHQGGYIVIEISDDGAGINTQRVLDKAIEKGLVASDANLSDEEIHNLIFLPGFSTAEVVSNLSGRGVGMDVVQRNIKSLGGTIELQSKSGIGSNITIRLPLTLAILDGQLVRVGDETFVLPLISIIESLMIKNEQTSAIAGGSRVYKLRDEYIPIVPISRILNTTSDNPDQKDGLMVVVEGGGSKIGLLVDDLLAQQQVVIKSLESNFKRIEGISGATILGDGTVALIIDVAGLIDFSRTIDLSPTPNGSKKPVLRDKDDNKKSASTIAA